MAGSYNIAVIPGDGIGAEVIPVGCDVLRTAANVLCGFHLNFETFSWGSEYYLKHGHIMPSDALEILEVYDALYVGAVGDPRMIPDHIAIWGLILPIRKGFDQYVNFRPIRLLPGITGPLRNKKPEDIDFVCVRENTEGEYAGVGGRLYQGTPDEVALQTAVFTHRGVERIMRYAFTLAQQRGKKVTSVTKSNVCQYSMALWDEVFSQLAPEYPDVETEQWLVDAMSTRFITHPETLGVVVASNLFGDILTDLGAALAGSLGVAASANLNPERRYPSMFEPVHGSAPDIAGRGIANPLGAIWAGSLLLDFLGEREAAALIMEAIILTTQERQWLTPDLGGRASTAEMGHAVCEHLRATG